MWIKKKHFVDLESLYWSEHDRFRTLSLEIFERICADVSGAYMSVMIAENDDIIYGIGY
jgi:hypothetical protein